MQLRRSSFGLGVALFACVGLLIRIVSVLVWQQHFELHGDQVFYHHQANALADGFGYVNPYALQGAGWLVPTAAHPPVYSTYLALFSLLGADSPVAHRLASCLLGAATVVLVALLARRLAGNRAGMIAAAIVAVYPNLWITDGGLVSESAYSLAVALVLFASYRAWMTPDVWSAVWLGCALGVATLTRAEALTLFALLAVPLILLNHRSQVRERVRLLLACAATGGLILMPWVARNLVTFENPVFISVGAGYVLEMANCDSTFSGPLLGYWSQDCDRVTWPYGDESVVELAKREVAVDYMKEHKDRLPVVVAARVGRMWDIYRPTQGTRLNDFFERRGLASSRAGLWAYYGLAPFALVGIIGLRRRGMPISPHVAIALSVTLAAAMSFGITRYRTGAEVSICLLAAIGLDSALGSLRSRGRQEATS